MPSRRLAIALALTAALLVSGTAFAVTTVLTGKAVTALKVVTDDQSISTISSEWQDIPGMSASIGVPADQKAVLVTTFSGEMSCFDVGWACYVRVLVDGSVAKPGQVTLTSDGETFSDLGPHSMQWAIGGVRAGAHTVKVQFRKLTEDGYSLHIGKRTLTVLRAVQ